MPVKKTIRRKTTTRVNGFAWTAKGMRSLRAMRASVAAISNRAVKRVTRVTSRVTRLTASIDKGTVAAVATTAAMIVALFIAGSRTMPAPAANDVALTASDTVQGDGFPATPRVAPAIGDARPAQTTTVGAVTPEPMTIAGC